MPLKVSGACGIYNANIIYTIQSIVTNRFLLLFLRNYFSQLSSFKDNSIKHSSIGINKGGNIFTPMFSYSLKNGKGSQAFSTFVL